MARTVHGHGYAALVRSSRAHWGGVIGHAALVVSTGLGPEWVATILAASPEIQGTSWNLSPTRWLGLWWLALGVPLAAWLFVKGRLGLGGLAMSPHIWPYYLLFALPDVNQAESHVPAAEETPVTDELADLSAV